MKNQRAVQYTIREVPPELDEALRRKARSEGKSLNRTTLDLLSTGLCLSGQPLRHHDLDFLIGSWVEDPEFDQAIRDQDRVDAESWQ